MAERIIYAHGAPEEATEYILRQDDPFHMTLVLDAGVLPDGRALEDVHGEAELWHTQHGGIREGAHMVVTRDKQTHAIVGAVQYRNGTTCRVGWVEGSQLSVEPPNSPFAVNTRRGSDIAVARVVPPGANGRR